ncbi:hypothetical protein ZOSMA_199G00030 [Zostera marina]|uniref:Uncharacterized protein n=1 Tax=Zostera marina TaxID=29655 RepID=A0A0K9PNL3_ZOSMR|nr:hypothetical protein ZOSMA_199G00030 [Zostera marina]
MKISTFLLTFAVLGSLTAAPAASQGETKCDACEYPSPSPPPPSPPPPSVIDCPPPPKKHHHHPSPPPPTPPLLPCWPCNVNIAPPGNLYPLDPGFYPNTGIVRNLVNCLVVSFLLQFLAMAFIIQF